jgi:hypothetical protein
LSTLLGHFPDARCSIRVEKPGLEPGGNRLREAKCCSTLASAPDGIPPRLPRVCSPTSPNYSVAGRNRTCVCETLPRGPRKVPASTRPPPDGHPVTRRLSNLGYHDEQLPPLESNQAPFRLLHPLCAPGGRHQGRLAQAAELGRNENPRGALPCGSRRGCC